MLVEMLALRVRRLVWGEGAAALPPGRVGPPAGARRLGKGRQLQPGGRARPTSKDFVKSKGLGCREALTEALGWNPEQGGGPGWSFGAGSATVHPTSAPLFAVRPRKRERELSVLGLITGEMGKAAGAGGDGRLSGGRRQSASERKGGGKASGSESGATRPGGMQS